MVALSAESSLQRLPTSCLFSYEKRFFRIFEDAMPPPPSFRREKISINKPGLPVKGWANCFDTLESHDTDGKKDIVNMYKGPKVFCIPGNHDW